ncbi:alpha/beta fold hydrolase [Ramlibacter rhizophilus]|uniref:Alpha/beta fold hydrolase n=1 Tax=Ramlibacter rhizophilus TaxID=1781167 RepID=A0A4Z0BIV5_9BURK|nr:alpha/beta fold hydrolase [Ramlibacter rhizophilus]TFY98710.1 alpha/beta fold hydrolase [Ramlibacter rhizophilus]
MSLHFERVGSGRPLLMVHGLGANLRTWDPILGALRDSRELILVDLPGHGRSDALAGPQTVEAYADALAYFVQSQGLSKADLVGSSVGGRLVLELARRGIGGQCVAFDPGGFWRGWETRWFHWTLAASIRLVRMLRPFHRSLSRHAWTRTLLLAQLSARPWLLPPHLVIGELQSLAATPVFDAMLRELAHGPLQQGCARTPGRVTIGWGRQDRLLLPRQAARAQAAFPSARLHWFERCGHFPHWDHPAETAHVILQTVDADAS